MKRKNQLEHAHALIMAGGRGERFWPWSRKDRPKQLLPIVGDRSMIETTVARLRHLLPLRQIWIVTNASQARAMARLMPGFPKSNFIVEPVGRDSAGAIMLGCAVIERRDPDAVVAVLPADHVIHDVKGYLKVLRECLLIAGKKDDVLITMGIPPTSPSSAYGYIERGRPLRMQGIRSRVSQARKFLEKPDAKIASRLVKGRRHAWNAGMFIWSLNAVYQAFKRHSPVHARGWNEMRKNISWVKKKFSRLQKISIDYAIMEKSRNILMVEGRFDWDDVGSWTALFAHHPLDGQGNCTQGKVSILDSRDCLVFGGKTPMGVLGVRDLIVVQTGDALLVCHKNCAQDVKKLLKFIPEMAL